MLCTGHRTGYELKRRDGGWPVRIAYYYNKWQSMGILLVKYGDTIGKVWDTIAFLYKVWDTIGGNSVKWIKWQRAQDFIGDNCILLL